MWDNFSSEAHHIDLAKLMQHCNSAMKSLSALKTLSVSARLEQAGILGSRTTVPQGLDLRAICAYSTHEAVVCFISFPQPNSFIYVSLCMLKEEA